MTTVAEALQIGWRRHQAGQFAAAEHVYRQVLQVAPQDENAWCFLGMACHDQRRYDEAVEAYEFALRLRPRFPVALNNLANTLKQLGRFEEAIARCQEALQYKPDYATAYNNLGVALVAQGRLEDASAAFEKALELMPGDAVARTNLGAALVRQGRFEEGAVNARKALSVNPNHAEAHKNQAIVWLLLGDFERGWPEYEWRWNCPGSALPAFARPLWDGTPLSGRTILLFAEQGLGDTLHFVRYANLLKQQGARTIVACQKPLLRLLETCPGVDQLVDVQGTLPPFDVCAPLLSLPGILKTTLETIPAPIPYLSADPQLTEQWRQRLDALPARKVGIAWQGSPHFHADRQRSIPLASFAPLARVPGVRLISLQKGPGAEQIGQLAGQFEVIDFGAELDQASGPFMDTAAMIAGLDLVVTADTSIAHLAGALGVSVWIALSVSPDWRWLLHREDSPWYPSARLFRQTELGNWSDVFERMAGELAVAEEQPAESPREFSVQVEISAGELLDKITILEIKSQRMTDPEKLRHVRQELAVLQAARDGALDSSDGLETRVAELRAANEALWDIEDEIRDCERRQDFGERFLQLARAVYRTNDRRSEIKRAINQLLGSRLIEEKSYETSSG